MQTLADYARGCAPLGMTDLYREIDRLERETEKLGRIPGCAGQVELRRERIAYLELRLAENHGN